MPEANNVVGTGFAFPRTRSCHPVFYLTTCQTLLKPSPVLSPGFVSFAHR